MLNEKKRFSKILIGFCAFIFLWQALSFTALYAQKPLNDSLQHAKRDSLQSLLKTRNSPAALTVYKTNPFSIIWGPIPFTAEYKIIRETAFAPNQSFLVGISYLGKSPLLSQAEKANQNNSIPNSGTNDKLKVRGFRFQFAYRYYLSKRKAPRGFYCGPQLSWSYATITPASLSSRNYYIYGTHFNINALAGYQVIIRDKVAFDFFFGLGYKKNTWIEHYSSTRSYIIHDFDNITPLYDKPVKVTLGINFGLAF